MIKEIDIVKPIHREIYEAALDELKSMTYPGYVKEAKILFPDLSENQVKNLIRGQKRSWKLLNAIRIVVGLDAVIPANRVTNEQVIKDLQLNKQPS